jgi:hypothetical protein
MIDILIVVYLIGVGIAYAKSPETMSSGERVIHALKWPLEAVRGFQSKK